MVELKKLLIGGLAATAMLADGAHAFTKYSEMSSNTLAVTTTIDGGACAAGSKAQGGLNSINVAWTGASTTSGNTMMVKLCYDDSELASKPWRKKKDIVNKNKRCKQTVVEADYLKAGITGGSATGNVDIPLPLNIAPAKYFIQVLESDSSGYVRYGDDSTCTFEVVTYDRLPQALVGTMSFFIAFSIIVATAGTMYDYKKQNAAAAQYA